MERRKIHIKKSQIKGLILNINGFFEGTLEIGGKKYEGFKIMPIPDAFDLQKPPVRLTTLVDLPENLRQFIGHLEEIDALRMYLDQHYEGKALRLNGEEEYSGDLPETLDGFLVSYRDGVMTVFTRDLAEVSLEVGDEWRREEDADSNGGS